MRSFGESWNFPEIGMPWSLKRQGVASVDWLMPRSPCWMVPMAVHGWWPVGGPRGYKSLKFKSCHFGVFWIVIGWARLIKSQTKCEPTALSSKQGSRTFSKRPSWSHQTRKCKNNLSNSFSPNFKLTTRRELVGTLVSLRVMVAWAEPHIGASTKPDWAP